ncbi:MAG: glycosyltransferase [Fibrobacteraceae bacterium]|nr:glycosyltransferase [Fibrobacteraceae bacterium]
MSFCRQKPLISIIVPIYNGGSFLKECIESLLKQSYSHIEIILVDDGSTDISGKICDDFASEDCRIKTIHQSNQGLSAARNTGIAAASGNYITFIDCDDFVSESFLDFLWGNLIRTNADISTCGFYKFQNTSNIESKTALQKAKTILYSGKEAAIIALYQNGIVDYSAWNKLYKKELFATIRFPKDKLFEDLGTMVYAMARAEKIVCSEAKLYYYRQHSKSILRTPYSEKNLVLLDLAESILNFAIKESSSFQKAAESMLTSASFSIILKSPRTSPLYRGYLTRAWENIRKYRIQCLFNTKTRLRTKTALLLSFFGESLLKQVWKWSIHGNT